MALRVMAAGNLHGPWRGGQRTRECYGRSDRDCRIQVYNSYDGETRVSDLETRPPGLGILACQGPGGPVGAAGGQRPRPDELSRFWCREAECENKERRAGHAECTSGR